MIRSILAILVLFHSIGSAEDPEEWIISDSSRIVIYGHSNVNEFRCIMSEYDLSEPVFLTEDGHGFKFEKGMITLELDGFDCGHKVLTQDFYETLGGDRYPSIGLDLKLINLNTEINGYGIFNINLGDTTKKGVVIELDIFKSLDSFYLKGRKMISMSDFGIEPPTKLFGLIQVQDIIEIEFELNLTRNNALN